MNEVIRAAADLQALCVAKHWGFCFIGGLAVLRWGEARETVDVDVTLLTGFGGEQPFIDVLLECYEPRVDRAAEFALTHRVLLVRAPSGVGIDIALGGLPFEELVVSRASTFVFPPKVALSTCSAEDLVVLKAFAARPKDWLDIDGVLARQTGTLDWHYIMEQLQPLAELKAEPGLVEDLQRRRLRFEGDSSLSSSVPSRATPAPTRGPPRPGPRKRSR